MIERNLADIVKRLQDEKRKLLVGLIWWFSPGHMTTEIDYLSRLVSFDDELNFAKPILILGPTEQTILAAKALLHSNINVEIIFSSHAFEIQREISLFYPELVVRVGNWDFRGKAGIKPNHEHNLKFLFCEDWAHVDLWYKEQWSMVHNTKSFNVFKDYYSEVLLTDSSKARFLEFLRQKPYVVVQQQGWKKEEKVWNGRAQITPQETYDELFGYALDLGYRLILCGRDEYSDHLAKFNVFDYPRSEHCSYENDFLLAGGAAAALMMASGLCHLYDFLNVKILSVGGFTALPFHYESSTILPCQLIDTKFNKKINFREQILSLALTHTPQAFVFSRQHRFVAQPLNANFIKDAFREILQPSISTELEKNILRQAARIEDPFGHWKLSSSYLPASINKYYPGYIP